MTAVEGVMLVLLGALSFLFTYYGLEFAHKWRERRDEMAANRRQALDRWYDPSPMLYNPRVAPEGPSGGSDVQHTLSPADRDMVYQTPKWWDQEFHKALEAVGAPRVVVASGDVEIEEWMGTWGVRQTRRVEYAYLPECQCGACATAKGMRA